MTVIAARTNKRSPNHKDKILGSRMKAYREIAGISQSELGGAVGVTFQQIQKYEHGTNKISVVRLLEICEALKVSITNVLNGLTEVSVDHATPLIVSDNKQQDLSKDPMVSKETTELLKVYYSVSDPKKRKAIVKFIKASMVD
ncbi:MAG: hypothetical protein COB76_02500 [Alphaproteobacteria bacterium]|nr:MAG: hypothetical protein COB76_02500 [Alphaproteobacteria bacterium]